MMQEVIIIFSFVKSVDLFAAIILQEILASALGHCLDAGGYIELEYYSVHPFGELRIKKIRGKWFEVDSIEAISCYTDGIISSDKLRYHRSCNATKAREGI